MLLWYVDTDAYLNPLGTLSQVQILQNSQNVLSNSSWLCPCTFPGVDWGVEKKGHRQTGLRALCLCHANSLCKLHACMHARSVCVYYQQARVNYGQRTSHAHFCVCVCMRFFSPWFCFYTFTWSVALNAEMVEATPTFFSYKTWGSNQS